MANDQIILKADLRGFIESMKDEELFAELHEGLYQMEEFKRREHTGCDTLRYLYFHLENQMLGLYSSNEFKVEVNGELLTADEVYEKFGDAAVMDYVDESIMLEDDMRDFIIYVLNTSELKEKERLIDEVRHVTDLSLTNNSDLN